MTNILNVDFPLLAQQKTTLIELTTNPTLTPLQLEHLTGLMHFIDHVEDAFNTPLHDETKA